MGLVNQMTKIIYRYTDILLVQSPEFKNYILNQGVKDCRIIYYPYYAEDFYRVVEKQAIYLEQFPKGFNLVFAGNIGVAQSFDTIISAFGKIKGHEINLVVLGDGRDKFRIQEQINEKGLTEKFHFLGSFPPEKMPHYFSCADGLLISLKKADIFSYTIPGKLQSYLACGKPIIGSLDGIGSKIISESNSGYVSKAEDSKLLAENIIKLSKATKDDLNKFSVSALQYFNKNFSKQELLENLENIFLRN